MLSTQQTGNLSNQGMLCYNQQMAQYSMVEFEHFGSTISEDCSLDKEISKHISKASHSFNSICIECMWYERRVKTTTKVGLFKSVILPILLYTWQ